MAVTFISSSTAASTASSSSETATAPTGRASGDALFAIVSHVASSSGNDLTVPTGWTEVAESLGSHSQWYLRREADGTSTDDLAAVITGNAGAISISVGCWRGIDPTAWVQDTDGVLSDTTSPYSSRSEDIGTTPGAFVALFSAQLNGTPGDAITWTADSGGTLRAQDQGLRTGFAGVTNFIMDALNVTGSNQVAATFSGNNLSGTNSLVFYNVTQTVTIETQGPFDPVRAEARADALSVATNFNAPPTDFNVSQSFMPEPLETIDSDIVTAFDESLTPGTAEFYYLPLGRQSNNFLQEFNGETMLARMARTYPPSIMELVSNVSDTTISSNLTSDNTVEARYVIEYVFSRWAVQYPWFNYSSPVPDLRVPLLGGDYTGDAGKLFTSTITIPQVEEQERSMLDVVQEFLAPFGAVKRVNDNNEFTIQPRYGPDADSSPVVTLVDNDLYALSTGDPSRAGTKNRVTITKRPYDRAEDTPALQTAYYQVRSVPLYDATAMITDRVSDPPDAIPGSRLDLTDGTGSSGTVGYGAGFAPLFWPANTGVIPETPVLWNDSTPTLQIDADFKRYPPFNGGTGSAVSFTSASLTISTTDLPLDGAWYEAIRVTRTETVGSFHVALEGRWVNERGRRGIEFRIGSSQLADYLSFVSPLNYWVGTFAIKLDDASVSWTDRGTVTTVTAGILDGSDPDYLESPTGTNAIEDSQTTRGIIEESISVGPYNPSVEVMNQMADGLLFDKIQPRSIRRGEQSVVRAFPIRFAHLGRLVQLPDGAQGQVMSRDYREASPTIGGAGDLGSGFEILITESTGTGAVADLELILAENGNTLGLEQGSGDLLLEA